MKQYLVVDLNSDWKELTDYKGLKNILINTVQNDLLMNCNDYDVSKQCSDILCKMAKEDYTGKWIKEELESYCYKTIDLLDLQRDLEDSKTYFIKESNKPCDIPTVFDVVLKIINDEVNK